VELVANGVMRVTSQVKLGRGFKLVFLDRMAPLLFRRAALL